MDLEIVWLEKAEENLYDIFLYYEFKASLKTSRKIILSIIESVDVLVRNPFIGQREELLKKHKTEYHYLVQGNYKIIYSFDKQYIYVHLVFDVRQNPYKLKKSKI